MEKAGNTRKIKEGNTFFSFAQIQNTRIIVLNCMIYLQNQTGKYAKRTTETMVLRQC